MSLEKAKAYLENKGFLDHVIELVWIAGFDSFGARNFQWQTDRLYNFLKYGFHM